MGRENYPDIWNGHDYNALQRMTMKAIIIQSKVYSIESLGEITIGICRLERLAELLSNADIPEEAREIKGDPRGLCADDWSDEHLLDCSSMVLEKLGDDLMPYLSFRCPQSLACKCWKKFIGEYLPAQIQKGAVLGFRSKKSSYKNLFGYSAPLWFYQAWEQLYSFATTRGFKPNKKVLEMLREPIIDFGYMFDAYTAEYCVKGNSSRLKGGERFVFGIPVDEYFADLKEKYSELPTPKEGNARKVKPPT